MECDVILCGTRSVHVEWVIDCSVLSNCLKTSSCSGRQDPIELKRPTHYAIDFVRHSMWNRAFIVYSLVRSCDSHTVKKFILNNVFRQSANNNDRPCVCVCACVHACVRVCVCVPRSSFISQNRCTQHYCGCCAGFGDFHNNNSTLNASRNITSQ